MRLMNRRPSRPVQLALTLLPFILILLVYVVASDIRLEANPQDKLLPGLDRMGDALDRLALNPDKRTGEYLFWNDTFASLERLGVGILCSAALALVFGLLLGAIPLFRAGFGALVAALSMVPPMALLPILFIVFGLGELSKVVLIVIGTAPIMMRDVAQRVLEMPREQLIKLQTLGGNTWHLIIRVLLPQVMPRLLIAIRLSLGPAWLFLIAAEAIAATDGLGYRIFLVRRYLAMDVILPYVAWITLLAFTMDLSLRQLSRWLFPWYHGQQEGEA